MIIKIGDIPEGGYHYDIKDTRETIKVGSSVYPVVRAYSGFMEISKTPDGRVVVEGSFSVSVRLRCSRCLEEFEFPIAESFRDVYYPGRYCYGHGVHELTRDDLDVLYYMGDEMDLSMVYLEKTYLAIPMKPLCREDCKGICPVCGKNLNYGACDCNRRFTDPRWAGLARIREKLVKR